MLRYNSNKYRTVLIIFLIMCILVLQVNCQKADALEAVTAPEKAILAALAVVSGVVFTSVASVEGTVQSIWDSLSSANRNYLSSVAEGDSDDIVFTWDLFQAIKNWIASLRSGEVTELEYEGSGIEDFYSYIPASNSSSYVTVISPRMTTYTSAYTGDYVFNITFPYNDGDNYCALEGVYNGTRSIFNVQVNKTGSLYYYFIEFNQDGTGNTIYTSGTYSSLSQISVALEIICDGVNTRLIHNGVTYTSTYPNKLTGRVASDGMAFDMFVSQVGTQVVAASSVTWDDAIVNDPTYDPTNRKVAIPPDWVEDISNAVGEGATTPDVSIDTPDGYGDLIGEQTGWLSNIWTKLATLLAVITGAITDFFDFSKEIDLDPLKNTGISLTTKFPFSLPWDLLHSFQTLAGAADAPEISLPFVFDTEINLNFEMFEPFIPMIKFFELLIFDIGLIFGTRRLLGGAV